MFGTSWRVGRIAGIEIRVDSSWAVIALLITYSMYLRFSVVYQSLSTAGAVGIAILAAVLFFGSVLVHELAHALVSQARGIRVQDITLFLFGGATRARVESRGPGDEFLIAVVGPLTSGILAALFWVVDVFGRAGLSRPLAGMFGYLAWVNLLLAAFNLVPGFPLDGGRLLRSAIWRATGSIGRATRIASSAGQAVGWLLVAGGVAFLLAGNLASGIWFAFIGWFLVQAARASYQELQVRHMLRGVEAQDVMAGNLLRIPPDLSLQDAVERYFMRYDHSAFPVDEQGRTIGLLTLRKVRRVPSEQWPSQRVRDHMVPLGDQVIVAPDAPMDQVMGKLEDGEAGRVLVVEDGEVVGIITSSDLTRWLRRWRALDSRAR
ncbi:MAG TPA: site-2 protease family protein [Actinomycetes bacterium]|jgi:Zn-dependent protease|nr:site-2 protease family protein [Actinomycetes bacterium]